MEPVRVVVTGAAGQIAYSLIFMIGRGHMFGPEQPVILHLFDISFAEQSLGGVKMEVQDCALPLVHGVVATTDIKVAFKDVDYAVFCGAFPRKDGMERADLLAKNASIFKGQGEALQQYAKPTVKSVVVGNPANTNALILKEHAPKLPANSFSALTRLDHNRAKGLIAERLGTTAGQVNNVIIWGNHSSTQYPDVSHAWVGTPSKSVTEAVGDENWLRTEFLTTVQKRGAAVIQARKLSSAASAAHAICDHMRNWVLGTPEGQFVSMAVPSDGSYGIKEGIIYSMPVTCSNGTYSIVQGLAVSDFSREKMDATAAELFEEKKVAFALFNN